MLFSFLYGDECPDKVRGIAPCATTISLNSETSMWFDQIWGNILDGVGRNCNTRLPPAPPPEGGGCVGGGGAGRWQVNLHQMCLYDVAAKLWGYLFVS